jgi:hypothetical protein
MEVPFVLVALIGTAVLLVDMLLVVALCQTAARADWQVAAHCHPDSPAYNV